MSSTTRDQSTIQDQQLCQVVEAIPPGQWMTYSDVAALTGHYWQHDTAGINQQLTRVGCAGAHRVLQSDGSIFSLALGDPEKVRRALRREGIDFDAGRADPSARVSINPQHSPAPTAAQAADAAVEAFWQEIGRQYPGLPGDYQPSALDKDFSGLAMLLVEQWLEGKEPAAADWMGRIGRIRTLLEYHDVSPVYASDPDETPESREYALVIHGHDADGPALYCTDTFGELAECAADEVLSGAQLVAAYNLTTGVPIPLHVSTPVVTVSEDTGAVGPNPFL